MKSVLRIFAVFGINILWIIILFAFLNILMGYNMQDMIEKIYPLRHVPESSQVIVSGWALYFFACVLAPLWEEVVFRMLPISFARKIDIVVPVILASSIIFGLMHGGVVNILIQGVGGLLLSWLYLKDGLWSAVVYHSLWNTFVIFLLPTLT